MAKSVAEAMDSLWTNLSEKTGRDRAAWIETARATGIGKHRDLVGHLKGEFGITHGYANAIALATLAPEADIPLEESAQIAQLYEGAKASLLPIHEALIQILAGFGEDIELSPKKGYVSLRRKKQFGVVQPSTATRLDVGLVLKGVEPHGRLEASGSFNAMLTHRVRLTSVAEVDSELTSWLRRAYDEA